MGSDLIGGELEVIQKYIEDDSIVFDVGAFRGEWSLAVLTQGGNSVTYCFEPLPPSYDILRRNLEAFYTQTVLNNLLVSDKEGESAFWEYERVPALSTIHKRNSEIAKAFGIGEPKMISVSMTTLDDYCQKQEVGRIGFLKIDVEGHEAAVMRGAARLLCHRAIDFIQFEYGECFADAGITLKEVFCFLLGHGFSIAKVSSGEMKFQNQFHPEQEDYRHCNYLAKL